ncbi:MAG: hypothetical protein QM478_11625 [Flavobacteriaceae bacterium]
MNQDNNNDFIEIKVDGDGSGVTNFRKPSCFTIKVDGDGSGAPFYARHCIEKK